MTDQEAKELLENGHTIEQLIECLNDKQEQHDIYVNSGLIMQDFATITKALEKQVAKKANVKDEEIGFSIYCPNCHSHVGCFTEGMNEPEQMKYCSECGQALKEY